MSFDSIDTEELLTGKQRIIAEAKRRFKQCEDWESDTRKRFLEDIRFANADPDNLWQWPSEIRTDREQGNRPCLTVNKVRQHNLQIINDAKQNKVGVKIRPVGNEATYDSAQIMEGIINHIEYISDAQDAYSTATKFQVEGGIGYWRIVTDYAGDDTFDQEIYIRRIDDPLSVYMDPDINTISGIDSRFAFIYTDMPKDEFREAYPQYESMAGQAALGHDDFWVTKDHVRICEYFRRIAKTDKMIRFTDPTTGEVVSTRVSSEQFKSLAQELQQAIIDNPDTVEREIYDTTVEWNLIIGDEVAETREWKGRYIPIIRAIGEETKIDGKLDRKGHTRALKDPQRIYNYWTSTAVEQVALQTKTPWVAPAQAIEGNEVMWSMANIINYSYLPWNHVDDKGQPIPPPFKAEPPTMAQAYLSGMEISSREMMMASGQYEANFGEQGNERTGKAINERQRSGERATYHYIDNLAISVRDTGKILIDLIPKIYDTPRVIRIMAASGMEREILLNPDPQRMQAYQKTQEILGQKVQEIFNPLVGRYDVISDVGPAYATRRQEAFNMLSQVVTQAPELMQVIGDLVFKNTDAPGAEEVAERLKRMVPPQALGEGPPPAVQQLQEQLQMAQEMIRKLSLELEEDKIKLQQKDQLRDIEAYDSVTKRLSVLIKEQINPRDIAKMVHDLMMEEHRVNLQSTLPNVGMEASQQEAQ